MMRTFASRFVLRCSLLASMATGAIGCSTNSNQPGGQVETPDEPIDKPIEMSACQKEFGDECGKSCSVDDECQQGLYCKGGACAADCLHSSDCPSGTCSGRGKCIEDDIMLNPVETDPRGPNNMPKCIEGQVEFKPVIPQVWLLLDRSGSMSSPLDSVSTLSRWAAMGNVLLGDPAVPNDRGVVGEFEDQVAFGVVFYTDGSGTAGCALNLESVALAANNYRDIRQRYNKLGPSGGTPTADSIAATVAVAATSDLTGGPKLLVLATDGVPGSCAPSSGADATTDVENEVAKAFAKQIQTFAISISTGTDVAHMQRVANIGVGKPGDETAMPAKLYTAESQADLKTAFSTILTDVPRSCVFSLNGRVKAENASEGTVVLNGQALSYQDADGWILKSPEQVELVGAACEQIRAGEDKLDINFPCRIFMPVE
jgi:hypothetical protein